MPLTNTSGGGGTPTASCVGGLSIYDIPVNAAPYTPIGILEMATEAMLHTVPTFFAYLIVAVEKAKPDNISSTWVVAKSENAAKLKAYRSLCLGYDDYDSFEFEVVLSKGLPEVEPEKKEKCCK